MSTDDVSEDRLSRALRVLLLEYPMTIPRIAIVSFILGFLGAVSIVMICSPLFFAERESLWVPALGTYLLVCVVYYHMAEFLIAALYRPHDTHPEAFLIGQSREYVIASCAALVEFLVEVALVPDSWKLFSLSQSSVVCFGLLAFGFYTIRVLAMVQCGANFSLQIETVHRSDHVLVQHGVYRYLRHPSYFGWFWRTVFSQFLLMNPICSVGFILVSWRFFDQRISAEEELLASDEFFGSKYADYAKVTPTGIPFIA